MQSRLGNYCWDPNIYTESNPGAYRRWTRAEDAELTSAVANTCKKRRGKEYKTTSWVAVTALVPGRNQCTEMEECLETRHHPDGCSFGYMHRRRRQPAEGFNAKGEKNINLGAFIDAKHAALAFNAEARRRGRPDTHLNFPKLHPCEAEIEAWKMNGTHYSMTGSQHKNLSQYRGVTIEHDAFRLQVNINKVLAGLGKNGPS
jgi:hypothetical protein